jgi:hypothetical protein
MKKAFKASRLEDFRLVLFALSGLSTELIKTMFLEKQKYTNLMTYPNYDVYRLGFTHSTPRY